MESIVFHARKSAKDKTPVFTVRFGMEKELGAEGTLLCVISKPHPYLETYCKKTGNSITEARLNCLNQEFAAGTRETIITSDLKHIKNFLPRGVTKVLGFYANRARKFFQLEDPKIVIRGTKLLWERKDIGIQAHKTPVILMTKLESLKV